LQAQLITAQAHTKPKFLIELAKPPQDKIVFKNLQRFKKIKYSKHQPDKNALDK